MNLKDCFIRATEEYNTFEKSVPAYYFRRSFSAENETTVKITVAVCGFYELHWNGKRITKGFLSPYVSNPDDYVYYDEYDVALNAGENVVGILLGNGFQNNPGGYIWDFDKAAFRSAPLFSLSIASEDKVLLCSDETFKTAPSPIRSDDYRFGEYYDANCEIEGWNCVGFDDSDWGNALPAPAPKGELQYSDIPPIVKECEIRPMEILPCEGGYIYDFGVSHAGICRLTVQGEKGQKIQIQHADSLLDGELNIKQVWFKRDNWETEKEIVHKDTYVCKGIGTEVYQPTFTYHGFRYVKVTGITESQATEDLLTYLVYHTKLNSRGGFSCSDAMVNTLQEMTRRSIVSNFHHFPTDCPQREKNGWTADAALTSEAALLNFDPEQNYRQWLKNIVKAQNDAGALPGIVPTGGWGFHWGNGPAWDSVLTYLPYFTYVYRGTTEMILESADAFVKYLKYLRTRCDENGLLSIGLGDWCHVGGIKPKAPLIVTDSIISMDIALKMAVMFDAVSMKERADFARSEAAQYRLAIRSHLLDKETLKIQGDCQSSQAMGLYYGVFEQEEESAAFARLLQMIHDADDHIDLGVLGGRVIFHVLSEFGYSDLAHKMIVREDYPSFGNWIVRGATTLWEAFYPDRALSMNHHFWGDISAWYIKRIAGLQLNPEGRNVNRVKIAPSFIKALDCASATHIAPAGEISVSWQRTDGGITLTVKIPQGMEAEAELENGYTFADGNRASSIVSGVYEITEG